METTAKFMGNSQKAWLDDELGCSKRGYKNEDIVNRCNGHSSNILHASFGDVEVSVSCEREEKFEHQGMKKAEQHQLWLK